MSYNSDHVEPFNLDIIELIKYSKMKFSSVK